jgi:hypothetical protein
MTRPQVVVGDVDFVVRLIEPDLLDAADDHRRGRRVLRSERRARGRLRCGIDIAAAAAAAAASFTRRWRRKEPGDRTRAAPAWSVRRD